MIRYALYVLAIGSLGASQLMLFKYGSILYMLAFVGVAVVLLIAAPRAPEPSVAAPLPEGGVAPPTEDKRGVGEYLLWFLRGLAAAGALYLAYKAQILVRSAGWWPGATYFLYAGLLLFVATFKIEKQEEKSYEKSRWRLPLALEAILFLFVFGTGAYFRLHEIDTTPPGCWYDEALHGQLTKQLIDAKGRFPVFCQDDREPSMSLYWTALWFKITGTTVLSLRLAPASIGILTVAFLYFFLRAALNAPAALAGTFLFAVARWHVGFSRVNFVTSIMAPFFAIATLYFFWRGIQSRKWRDFLLGGFALGMCTHTYQPAWFMGPMMAFLFLLKSALVRGFFGAFLGRFIVAAIISFVIFAPLGWYFYRHPGVMTFRSGEVTIFKSVPKRAVWEIVLPGWWRERWPILGPNLRTTAFMYNKDGDVNGRHNLPAWPVLEEWTAVLFGLGWMFVLVELGACILSALLDILARIFGRGPPGLYPVTPLRTLGIMAWVTWWAMIWPGAITIESPQALRTIVAMVPIFSLTAIALYRVWQCAEGFLPGTWFLRVLPAAVVAFGLFRIAGNNYNEYFKILANHRAVWSAYSPVDHGIGEYVKKIWQDVQIYSDHISHPTIEFVVGRTPPYKYVHSIPVDFLPIKDEPERDVLFILLPFNKIYVPLFRSWYPGGKLEEFEHTFPDGTREPMFFAYRIPLAEAQKGRGLRGRYFDGSSTPAVDRSDAKVSFAAGADHELAKHARVEWTGVVFVPGTGDYVFGADATGSFSIELDGATILSAGGGKRFTPRMPLTKGLHPVRVTARGGRGSGFTLLFGPTSENAREIGPGSLHPVELPQQGLLARYWQAYDWNGRPTFHWVDSKVNFHWNDNPLNPWAGEWIGWVDCPRDGKYVFGLESAEQGFLWIDGKLAVHNDTSHRGQYFEGSVDLKKGKHHVRLRFTQSYCDFYWTPPQGVREIVPTEALSWRIEDIRWKDGQPTPSPPKKELPRSPIAAADATPETAQ